MDAAVDVDEEPADELAFVLGHEQPREAGIHERAPAAQVALALLEADAEDVGALAQERRDALEALAATGPRGRSRSPRPPGSAGVSTSRGRPRASRSVLALEVEAHDVDARVELVGDAEAGRVHRGLVGRVGVALGVEEQVARPDPARPRRRARRRARRVARPEAVVRRPAPDRPPRRRAGPDERRRSTSATPPSPRSTKRGSRPCVARYAAQAALWYTCPPGTWTARSSQPAGADGARRDGSATGPPLLVSAAALTAGAARPGRRPRSSASSARRTSRL